MTFALRRPRGGPHNSGGRESFALSEGQIGKMQDAFYHAELIGLPFTRMITIHWQSAGVELADMAAATGKFIDCMSRMLAHHGSQTAWIWVHENGPDKGGHCHMLVHVPAGLVLSLSRRQRRWIETITGAAYRKKTIVSRPIGGRLGLENSNRPVWERNASEAFGYSVKGADPVAVKRFGLTRRQFGGFIIGKRCGFSQNIGPKARRHFSGEGEAA